MAITDGVPVFVSLAIGIVVVAFNTAYGQVDYFQDEYYDIPKERLPFQLRFSATSDGLSGSEVSRIELTLYDNRTNGKIKNVSFFIALQEVTAGDPILIELFYAENGTLTLILAHSNGEYTLVENSFKEQFLNAWVADGAAKPNVTTISSARIQEKGANLLTLELLTVDDVSNIIREGDVPKVEYILDTNTNVSTRFTLIPEYPFALPILVVAIFMTIVCATFKMKI